MNRLVAFEEAARAACSGRKRATPDDHLWPAFQQVFAARHDAAPPRRLLRELLDELREENVVRFPAGSTLFDRGAQPPLPRWVEWTASEEDASAGGFSHREHCWHPSLAWIAGLRFVRDADMLLAIDSFLKSGGGTRPIVPARERSLELFGDEKRIDSLATSPAFVLGRLSYDLLRCKRLSPPFVWQAPADSSSGIILVIENHHTWHSFCEWNAASRRYAAIVYGAGTHFEASVAGLEDLLASTGAKETHYFGDLDPEGLHIPWRAGRWCHRRDLPPILPAADWYRLLLERGSQKGHPLRGTRKCHPEAYEWLSDDLRAPARGLIESGYRLPQEYIGTECLLERK